MPNATPRPFSGRLLLAAGLILLAGATAAGVTAEAPAAQGLVPPRILDAPEPMFPHHGRPNDIEDDPFVVVRLEIDAEGNPGAATVHRSPLGKVYQDNALKAIKRWKFEPARRDGVAVAQTVLVPVKFVVPTAAMERQRADSVEPLGLQRVRPPAGEAQAPSAGIKPD